MASITTCTAHLVNRLQVQRQVEVVDGIVFGTVIDVWDLADVILLLLLVVEGLEQLAPSVKHQQQALAATWYPCLQHTCVLSGLGLTILLKRL